MDRTATFRISPLSQIFFTERIDILELLWLPFVDGWFVGVIIPRFVVIFELALDFADWPNVLVTCDLLDLNWLTRFIAYRLSTSGSTTICSRIYVSCIFHSFGSVPRQVPYFRYYRTYCQSFHMRHFHPIIWFLSLQGQLWPKRRLRKPTISKSINLFSFVSPSLKKTKISSADN